MIETKPSLLEKIVRSDLTYSLVMIALGVFFGGLLLLVFGYNPIEQFAILIQGVFGSAKDIAWMLIQATPIMFTGLAIGFAFKAKLFNIGAEGQFIMGSVFAFILGYSLHLPAILHIPVVLIGGFIGGGLLGWFTGFLKVKFNVHEVISSIMFNYIALNLCNYIIKLPAFVRDNNVQSEPIQETAKTTMPIVGELLGSPTLKFNIGIFLAIGTAFILYFVLKKTVFGYNMKAVGHNHFAAEAAGINVKKTVTRTMFISGGICGLGGAIQLTGVLYSLNVLGGFEGYGFTGIGVALVGNCHPIGIIFSALLFGTLSYGGSALQSAGTPSEIVEIITGFIVFFISMSYILKQYLIGKLEGKKNG